MKIILTLEQFPAFWSGAFGSKIEKTPGLDAFTLESTVFDRAYSSCADGLETLFQLWESCHFEHERFTGKKIFLSDLPVEAPDFFDAGETISAEEFFSNPDRIFQILSEFHPEKNFSESVSERDSFSGIALVWIHFQEWTLPQFDSWLQNEEIRKYVSAILGTSGEIPDGDVRLYSAEVQLPWWIRFTQDSFAGTRSHALVTAQDFQKILDADSPDANFRDRILILAENDRWAFVTDEWFLTGFETRVFTSPNSTERLTNSDAQDSNGTDCGNYSNDLKVSKKEEEEEEEAQRVENEEEELPELYFKPADWWDQNDVAVRCFDEVQELLRLRNETV